MTRPELKEAMLNEQLYGETYYINDVQTLQDLLREALWQMYQHNIKQETIVDALDEEWFEE
jgi:hypothetical protein